MDKTYFRTFHFADEIHAWSKVLRELEETLRNWIEVGIKFNLQEKLLMPKWDNLFVKLQSWFYIAIVFNFRFKNNIVRFIFFNVSFRFFSQLQTGWLKLLPVFLRADFQEQQPGRFDIFQVCCHHSVKICRRNIEDRTLADGWTTVFDGWTTVFDGWTTVFDCWTTVFDGWTTVFDGWTTVFHGFGNWVDFHVSFVEPRKSKSLATKTSNNSSLFSF